MTNNSNIANELTKINVCISNIVAYITDDDKIEEINQIFKQKRIENQIKGKTKGFETKKNIDDNIIISKKKGVKAKMTKRKDGRWMGRFRRNDGSYKCVYGKTKQECNDKLVQALKEYDDHIDNNNLSGEMKLIDCIKFYLDNLSNLKESSHTQYLPYLNILNNNKIANIKIKNISFIDIKSFLDSLDSSNKKNKCYCLINLTLDKMKDIGLIKYNYCALLPKNETSLKVETTNGHKYISNEIATKFYNTTFNYNKNIACMIKFLIAEGLRIGEACGLKWSDIDFKNNIINVERQLSTVGITSPKSKSGIRKVPLFKSALDVLNIMKDVSKSEFIFDKYTYESWKTIIKYVNNKYNFDISFHDCRHTFITNCFQANINPKVVQAWSGHSNYEITINTYTHLLKDKENQAIKELENYNKIDTNLTQQF